LTKRNRQLLAALSALILLGAGYLLIRINEKQDIPEEAVSPVQRETYVLSETDESTLQSLTVENRFGTYTLVMGDGGIRGDGRSDVKLNQQAALSSVYTLGNIRSYEIIDEAGDPASYGLEPPAGTMTLTSTDGAVTVVKIGGTNPSGSGYYAMKEGDPAVYLLTSYLGSSFLNSLDLLRDRTLPPVNLQELTRLTIRGERTIDIVPYFPYEVFSSTLSPFLMVKPYHRPVAVNTETYSKNLETLSGSYTISRFIDGDEADQAGITDDSPEIYMQDKQGNEVRIQVGNSSDQGDVYCRVSTVDGIVTLPAEAVGLLNVTALQMADKFVRLIGIDSVKEVKVETPDESWTGTVKWTSSEKDEGEFTFQGVPIEEDPFKKMYQEVLYLLFEGEIPDEFKPSGQPDFRITYTGDDSAPGKTSAEFFDYNQDFYAVSIDGYSPEFLIGKYQIEAVVKYLRNFKG